MANSNDHLLGAVTIFIITAIIASTLLMIAFVAWFADIVGSLLLALTLLGGLMAIIATMLYLCVVRPSLRQLHNEMRAILDVAQLINSGYSWVAHQLSNLLK